MNDEATGVGIPMATSDRRSVLHVLADGRPGGGSTAVLGLCADVRASGWETALVTQPQSNAMRAAGEAGIPVVGFDFFTSRFDFRIAGRLASVIVDVQPDIIHVHGARSAHAFCSPPLRDLKVPLVYTVHGFHFARKRLIGRLLGREAERRIARRADKIIFVSESDRRLAWAEGFIARDSSKGTVVYNGVDPRDFEGLRPMERVYDLVFIGRAHPQKNPLFMIDVMSALKGSGLSLLVIGGGELDGEMRARAKASGVAENITFAGSLPRGEALRGLVSASVYLLPSLWEGLPIGPIEALYCGLPVVASKVAGTDEVVIDGVNGFLIESFDAARYAERILQLISDEPLRRRFGRAGQTLVRERFMRLRSSMAHVNIYQRALDRLRSNDAATAKPGFA